MPTFEETSAGYRNMWEKAVIRSEKTTPVENIARKILTHQSEYEKVEAKTRVPWFLVGALHSRESDLYFSTHLHNGDPLSNYTRHVPADRPQVGHGPPFTWEESAVDALVMRGLEKVPSWPIERMLYEAEAYNGWGYTYHGVNSPYIWGATNLQQPGKYVADGVWAANAEDQQPGVAAILKSLCALSPDIATRINSPPPAIVHPPVVPTPPAPTPTPPIAKPEHPMTTPVVPAAPINDPIPAIIAALEVAEKYLPMVAGFLPPPLGPAITVAIPIIQELLQLVEDAKSKSGVDLFQAIGAHLQSIGQHVQTVAATAAAQPAISPPVAASQQAPTG